MASFYIVVLMILTLVILNVSGEGMLNASQQNQQSDDENMSTSDSVTLPTLTKKLPPHKHETTVDDGQLNEMNNFTDEVVSHKYNYSVTNRTEHDTFGVVDHLNMTETKSEEKENSDWTEKVETLGETTIERSLENVPTYPRNITGETVKNISDTKYKIEFSSFNSSADSKKQVLEGEDLEEPSVVVVTPVTSVIGDYTFRSDFDKSTESHPTTTLATWDEKPTSGSLISELLARRVRTIASPTKLSETYPIELSSEATEKHDSNQSVTQSSKHDYSDEEIVTESGAILTGVSIKSPVNQASSIEVRENGHRVMIQPIVKPQNITMTKLDSVEDRNKQALINETDSGNKNQTGEKQSDIDRKKSEPLISKREDSHTEIPQRKTESINITCREANQTDITRPRNLTIIMDDEEGLLVKWLQPFCLETFTSYYVTIIKGKSRENILYYTEVPCTTDLCTHIVPKDNITEEGDQNVFVVGRWEQTIGKASSVLLPLAETPDQPTVQPEAKTLTEVDYNSKMSTNTPTQTPETASENVTVTVDTISSFNEREQSINVDKTTETQITEIELSITEDNIDVTEIYPEPKHDIPDNGRNNKSPLCTEAGDSNSTKVQQLSVQVNVNSVLLSWQRPECIGTVIFYEVTAVAAIRIDNTTKDHVNNVKCYNAKCLLEINTTTCSLCFAQPSNYKFRVSAIIDYVEEHATQTIESSIDIRGCTEFKTPIHAMRTCTGGSKVVRFTNGRSETVWGKNAYCQVQCNKGYGFYRSVSSFYTCQPDVGWQPQTKAPDCLPTTSIAKATLQYKLIYDRGTINDLESQFPALVQRYAASLCQNSAPNCTMTKVYSERYKPSQTNNDTSNRPKTEVTLTVEPPVRQIADQNHLIANLEQYLATEHNADNRFMTLLDWQQLQFVLPLQQEIPGGRAKARAALCCHECPLGYQYRHNSCVRCPLGEQCHVAELETVDSAPGATNVTEQHTPATNVSEELVMEVKAEYIGDTTDANNSSSAQ